MCTMRLVFSFSNVSSIKFANINCFLESCASTVHPSSRSSWACQQWHFLYVKLGKTHLFDIYLYICYKSFFLCFHICITVYLQISQKTRWLDHWCDVIVMCNELYIWAHSSCASPEIKQYSAVWGFEGGFVLFHSPCWKHWELKDSSGPQQTEQQSDVMYRLSHPTPTHPINCSSRAGERHCARQKCGEILFWRQQGLPCH